MMENDFLRIDVVDGVGRITLDRKGERINTISSDALEAIDEGLSALGNDTSIRGIVIESGKPDSFVVGADVRELQAFERPEQPLELSRRAHEMISRVRNHRKPIVAALHGPALGGGLELALACTYRVAARDAGTHFGLPEVRLGLLPGGGGTQLLPRLVGIQQALGLMLTGKNVYPRSALRMGLVDVLTHRAGLSQAAMKAARQLAGGKRSSDRSGPPLRERVLESTSITRRVVYQQAERRVMKQTRGNYPAPSHIIECVRTGMEDGIDAGFEAEAKSFSKLVFSPVAQELIFLFFAQRAARHNPWEDAAMPIRSIGVLGGGLMGGGIAALSAERGLDVALKDISLEHAASARRITYRLARSREKKHAISRFERDAIVERVRPIESYTALGNADVVIEAVPEDLEIKREVIGETEKNVCDECVIASNTSSIPISTIAATSKHPERIIGMHYFSPVPKMPLLEIIRTRDNTDRVVATAFELGLRQNKTVIVVNDGPGFYTTRVLAVYMNEALFLLEEGGTIEAIDAAVTDFGFPMGPYALFDLVGIDVAAKIDAVLGPFFDERGVRSSDRSRRLSDHGIKGQKSGAGFYHYTGGNGLDAPKRGDVNANVYAYFGGSERTEIARGDAQNRLSMVFINEAVHCLSDGILNSPTDGDLGAVFGLGFPPFLGGPFRYVDRLGADEIMSRLEELEQQHGPRYRPAPLLVEMARSGERFHD